MKVAINGVLWDASETSIVLFLSEHERQLIGNMYPDNTAIGFFPEKTTLEQRKAILKRAMKQYEGE